MTVVDRKPQAMESLFAAILADAAKLYSESSGNAISLGDFSAPQMNSVEDLKHHLELQNGKFSQFREKRQSIFDAISVALRPVELVGEMVAGAASDVFAPAQSIFCAVMYLVNAANNVSSMYDSIVELFDQLKDFTGRLNVYVKHELTPVLREKLVSILATLFEVLVIATEAARRGRFKAYFKKLIGSEGPAQPALDKLKALTLGEERQVLAETYGGVSQLNIKTDRVEGIVGQISRDIQEMKLEQLQVNRHSHRDKLREILEPSPFAEDFYMAFNKYRVHGTGDWLLEDEGLMSWLNGETPYLWICGSPGTGKSFLTARVISWGMENLPHLAYFFFRDNNPETRSVLQALRDVAYQLSEGDAFYADTLMQQLHSSDDIKTVASAFRRLLVQPCQENKRDDPMYIFLDGIDEAEQDEIEEFLSLLAPEDESIQSTTTRNIRFALIGRSYLSDTVTFALDPNARGRVFTTVHVTPDRSAADVSAFITDGVRNSRILARSSAAFKQDIIAAMETQVDGLFILAKFMLTEINRKRHPSSILKSLESFPKEINGMLSKTIANLSLAISEEEAEDLNEMLRWVSCVEESLTLGQLEAALILRFGDPPLRLEEALRGQYACFFELEREDGRTTDDLIKDFARQQRELDDEPSPTRQGVSRRRFSSSDTSSPGRKISPGRRNMSPGQTSPSLSPAPFNRQYSPSPARSLGGLDQLNEIDFRSNKSTTRVSFFHTSVKQFFREGYSTAAGNAGTVGVDTVAALVHILKTCLRIFNDKEWFDKQKLGRGKDAMKQYAAWYWQEHLAALDPETVSRSDKSELSMSIYKMLTVESIIFDWSIMYEKNNEGLEVLTDRNIRGLKNWFSDAELLASLTTEAREFVSKCVATPLGVCEPIGRFYAKAWLSAECQNYIPTLFCFKIVQNMAFMSAGHAWSQGHNHWSETSLEERMSKALEWANYPETAHWHLRVGSTYLMLGKHNSALSHYNRALEFDHNSVHTSGRIAFCLFKYGRYGEALVKALECADLEEKTIAEGTLSGYALRSCKWRLYKDYLIVGQCYYLTGNIDLSLEYFRKTIQSATQAGLHISEHFEAEAGYLEVLAAENRHEEMMALLEEMSLQITGSRKGQSRLDDLFLDQYNKPLVMDWIPKAACTADKAEFILDHFESSIETAHTIRDPTAMLYLRLAFGTTCAYNLDLDDAIAIFGKISLVEYRPRGSVPTRQGHALSFQKLAALYKQKILATGLNTPEAKEWIKKLEHVQEKQSKHQNQDMPPDMFGSDVNVASIYLALFYRLLGRKDEANSMLSKLVLNSLDILTDDNPRNDEYALDNLLRVFVAADDTTNALALAQSMRRINPHAILKTPTESPILTRIEPKLPDVQSTNRSCAQCLANVSPSTEFFMCRSCMDSFCAECLEGVIKQDGNKTGDCRDDVVCRSDHDWITIPPLNQFLHTGQILMHDGQVIGFTEWESQVREKWRNTTA